jgi:hypothetical protein
LVEALLKNPDERGFSSRHGYWISKSTSSLTDALRLWDPPSFFEVKTHKPARKADDVTAICRPDPLYSVGSSTSNKCMGFNGHLPGHLYCLHVDNIRTSQETHLWASMAFYGDDFTFLYVDDIRRPPLWSSGQSSWLLTQRSGFDSRSYQIF